MCTGGAARQRVVWGSSAAAHRLGGAARQRMVWGEQRGSDPHLGMSDTATTLRRRIMLSSLAICMAMCMGALVQP